VATPAREARIEIDPGGQLVLFDVPERALSDLICPTSTSVGANGRHPGLTLGEARPDHP
jgi:hypothetical protein